MKKTTTPYITVRDVFWLFGGTDYELEIMQYYKEYGCSEPLRRLKEWTEEDYDRRVSDLTVSTDWSYCEHSYDLPRTVIHIHLEHE